MKIVCENVSKSYGSHQVLGDISFTVGDGQFFAMIGANGAGKTTLLDIITKRIEATSGNITIGGDAISKKGIEYFKEVGIVFQDHVLDEELTIEQNLKIRASIYLPKAEVLQKVDELLTFIQLADIADHKYKTLSGGQKRKVDIATSLIHEPNILFLDEPTTGVDVQSRQEIWQMIHSIRKEKGMTLFLTTHYLEEAEQAEQMILLDKGEIVAAGTPIELKQKFAKDILLLVANDEEQLEKCLDESEITYTRDRENYVIQLQHTKDSLPIITKVQQYVEAFEVKLGTLDDVFIHFIDPNEN